MFNLLTSASSISRFLVLGLLLLTFSLGLSLAVVIGERNTARATAAAAAAALKEKTKEAAEKQTELDGKAVELTGCFSSLQVVNQAITEASARAKEADDRRSASSAAEMASLPSSIIADRQASATPAATNAWLQELMK